MSTEPARVEAGRRAGLRIQYVSFDLIEIRLHQEYRTHTKRIREHRNLLVKIRSGGRWGYGEAYTLEPEACLEELRSVRLRSQSVWNLEGLTSAVQRRPARAALDLALHDLHGKLLGLPLARLLGLPDRRVPTAISIGIQEEDQVLQQAKQWVQKGYTLLKIKVGRETDLGMLRALRRAVGDRIGLWVDANQAWDPSQAARSMKELESVGALFVEQPLPVGALEECAALRRHTSIPIYLDEEIQGVADVIRAHCAGGVDGINVKLSKCGGLRESLHCISAARSVGMKVLLGCFFESSLTITAASHLQGLADYLDLDACLYLDSQPAFQGAAYMPPHLCPPVEPGIGARLVSSDPAAQ